ncbi:hypothetical protein P8452_58371 [Trifolium repens]|nr:hypothetical protein P8452_58371 [Trifolium repens]
MNTYHVKFDCNSAVGKMLGLPMGCVHLRAAIEYQKKGPTENYEHGRVMENMLIVMAREMKKLRAEIASAEKRSCPPLEIHVAYMEVLR